MSGNINAINLLEKYPEKINWDLLSFNPNAIHLLEKNPDKNNWYYLYENKNAIYLLEKIRKKYIGNIFHQIYLYFKKL